MAKYIIFGYGGIGQALTKKLLDAGEDVLVISSKAGLPVPSYKVLLTDENSIVDLNLFPAACRGSLKGKFENRRFSSIK